MHQAAGLYFEPLMSFTVTRWHLIDKAQQLKFATEQHSLLHNAAEAQHLPLVSNTQNWRHCLSVT